MTTAIRVIVTDDHVIVRDGLQLILETAEGIEVVGVAADGEQALRLTAEQNPDVILMDLRMPNMDGLTAIEHLQRDHSGVAVVILTTYNEDQMVMRALQAGAKGYILKDVTRESLIRTIQAAARGETLLSPEVMQKVLAFSQSPPEQPKPKDSAGITLTDREQEVLEAVATGETNKGIAFQLGISERTVKAHLKTTYDKLGVDSRAAAIAVAAQRGMLPPVE
ncbi:MAG: response regulator transcription factor [Anaerolineales bacterium]|nr:response regulator transcription factor [Chloroflexota bacterium]MBL6980364.1 response regulator transcription factor [Anaerolineales bacterium]